MEHIQRTSQKFISLINLLLVCVPAGIVLYWMFFNALPEGFRADLPVQPANDLPGLHLALATLATAFPAGVGLYGLVTLRTLFRFYACGDIFTAETVKCFSRLGYTLIAWTFASVLFTPLLSVILSFANPAGARAIVIKLGIGDLSTLIVGAVVLLIASVMNRACELEDEQAYTI